ncbi:hypothetical protein CNMCM6936_009559 [Aspergillus lentulus]|nr:hypothetical protein CNMCM6069_000279 [Aspergillus lentulus]KAF4164123.1 hypothetical protein CNMCM6936_009559 [Aspergillus lentulus]
MLSPPIAVTRSQAYPRENVMDIPRRSGLLTPKELSITENWDVRGLLAQMRQGTLSAEDVVRAFSKRAAIAHQVTRCLTEPLFPSAIQQAQHLDSVLQRTGRPVGPLHGLPVSVKDCFRIKGVDSCIGLTALAFKPSTFHARLVNMLLSLGAVIIAKTNVSQGMAAPDSYNHVFGRTLNPLNHRLTVGGSSGGEAALVAMRGSMVGFGTDIGGSIRVPAMCTGLYGFKPSVGRIPFGGVVTGQPAGLGRVALQGVAGPLARSVADLGTVLAEIIPIAERFGEDCIPGRWKAESLGPDKRTREFTVGVLRTDDLVTPLPPVAQVLDEVADSLRRTPGVRVVDVPVPPALRKCQGIAGRLMGADGGGGLLDLLESTSEPLIPWLQKRMKRREALSLEQLIELQEQRSDIEKELLGMWTVNGDCTKRIDAIITPVAPHPVPEIDRFNAIGYTASFVLLDCPAGTIPVRNFTESDLDSGNDMDSPVLGSWDRVNRELWQGKSVDRRVYLDSPLSIQVVTPKQHDYELHIEQTFMAQPTPFQLRDELTILPPVRGALSVVPGPILQQIRELKKTGSDFILEEDLATVFGRAELDTGLERLFRSTVIIPGFEEIYPSSEIRLASGPGPTVLRALKESHYLSTIIQLSFLGFMHERTTLATNLVACLNERHHLGAPDSNPANYEGVCEILRVCASQTSSFPWDLYIGRVEAQLPKTCTFMANKTSVDELQWRVLTPNLLLAAMDYLCLVQAFPGDRLMAVPSQAGLVPLVVWAHHILGLTVLLKGSPDGDVLFGHSSSPQITIKWCDHIDLTDEVYLLDSKMEILLSTELSHNIHARIISEERCRLKGYGTKLVNRFKAKEDDMAPSRVQLVCITLAFCRVVTPFLYRVDLKEKGVSTPLIQARDSVESWRLRAAADILFSGVPWNPATADAYTDALKTQTVERLLEYLPQGS